MENGKKGRKNKIEGKYDEEKKENGNKKKINQ